MTAIRARALAKAFGRTVAVDSVDLDVPAGAVLGVLGPNGSGKTTLIRMLLTLSRPTSGHVELLGERLPDGAGRVLPRVGALVEGPGFHPFLSGKENLLRLAAAEPTLPAAGIARAVDDSLERVGLTGAARRRYRAYSLGMKQRLGLAAVLLVPRELIVLDEPTNGLDPAGTRQVRQIIAELHESGATVLVSSHLLAEVEATCTHVAVMQRGSLLATGPLDTLLAGTDATLDVATPEVDLALHILRESGAAAVARPRGVQVGLDGISSAELIASLVHAGVPVHEARRRHGGLEELFTQLTESDQLTPGSTT